FFWSEKVRTPIRSEIFSRKSASPFRKLSSPDQRPIQPKRRRSVCRGVRVREISILPRRRRLHSNSQQTSLKKRSFLPLSLCCGLQLFLWKKQEKICRMEFLFPARKVW